MAPQPITAIAATSSAATTSQTSTSSTTPATSSLATSSTASSNTSSQVASSSVTSSAATSSVSVATSTSSGAAGQTAYWNYNWAYNTYGTLPPANSLADLSATTSSAGMTMPIPSGATSLNMPGYHIAACRAYPNSSASTTTMTTFWADITSSAGPGATPPSDKSDFSYSTLTSAANAAVSAVGGVMGSNTLSSAPAFNFNPGAAYWQNYFGIYLEANKESGAVKYSAAPGTTVVTSALPASQAVSNGYGGYVGIASYTGSAVSSAIPAGKYTSYVAQSNASFTVAALSSGYEYQGITAPDGKEYTGYTNFVAPSNTKTGSVTLYIRNTTTGAITSSNAVIPAITVGNNYQLTSGGALGNYIDTTSYGSLAAGSSGYGSTAVGATSASMTGLLQALGFVFPYGESGAPISNNNTFTVDVAPWQKLDFAGSYAAGTPGTGSAAGTSYGNFNKISGYLSNSMGAVLGSEAPAAGSSAGKAAWLNYTSAVNSAASAAGVPPVFTNAGTTSAAVASMGYNVQLLAYNSAGASSYFPSAASSALTSGLFSQAANYAGSNYTSVLNSAGVEQDQVINLVFTPKKQFDAVNVYYPDDSSKWFTNNDPAGSSYANGTGAPILGTTGASGAISSGVTLSSFVGGSSASNFPVNSGATDNSNSSTNIYMSNATYTTDNGQNSTAYSNTSSMTALAAALSAHPYLDNVDNNKQEFDVNYAYDRTTIYSQDQMSAAVGAGVTAADALQNPDGYDPAFTNYNDGNTQPSDYQVNGKAISYTIADSKGNQVVASSNITDGATVIGQGLDPGTYTVTFTVFDNAGAKITSTTQLTISTFVLPYTGGEGGAGIVVTAATLGIAGGLYLVKRRKSDLETKRK